MHLLVSALFLLFSALVAKADRLTPDQIATYVKPPHLLGEPVGDKGVYTLVDVYGAEAGFIFETEPIAPLPGFSGAPINMIVMLDREGNFIDVELVEQNEPIFVSGLGVAPFEGFLEQYQGLNIATPMVVGTPYGNTGADGSSLTYLDGVTKATASVRIAHESILAATLAVARDRMQGLATSPPAQPDPDYREDLDWEALVNQGLASHHIVSNAETQEAFAGTLWEDDDPEAQAAPQEAYIDLWIVDLGPPSIARAVLSDQTLEELNDFLTLSPHDEPILLIETARHGLVGEDFVRNTAPDWISAEQGGLPVALRDADLYVELRPDLPEGSAMILRADRRLGFNPAQEWQLSLQVRREHGSFRPVVGTQDFTVSHRTPDRFFVTPDALEPLSPWREALRNRQTDVIALGLGLALLLPVLLWRQSWLAGLRHFTPVRLGLLAVTLGFIGWWGQGQLSIVTPLATLRTALDGGSLAFLLYDPFSLLLWMVTILGFVLWGRGLFCGWLCPFGAMQEFAHHLGRMLRLPRLILPRAWDRRLKSLKYVILAGLVATVFLAPDHLDSAAEVEPFKTAITTFFLREWYFSAYAALWLLLGMTTFKGFCRYVCPLGALMAIGGLLRLRRWIPRRVECGSPCQLCRVRCNYRAIKPTGEIEYDECFQCLDCVTIHDSTETCVPLVLARRQTWRRDSAA
ncbi:4Fe-4S binding protein [Ruegeria marina]|uniref:Regulator of nitric oxide reductase transcription n=1 Tax=Ruegeria marina TaxID=639004 RepID=A0A1G6X923_9RHOB|nr:4Fe-4S binding protein [Ruegeria marina]SDD74323.1 Regulator of nitric oxide reductase transcription [Ruegeria marina]